MTVATEVAIPAFSRASPSGNAWVGSQNVQDVAILSLGPVGSTSGFFNSANGQAVVDTSGVMTDSGLVTGSWPGNANNWDILDLSTVLSGVNSGLVTGSWPGNANNWDIYEFPAEEHDTDVISSDNPEANQSTSLVEWNHFPFPEASPAIVTRPRDASRFTKSYSFTRQQPVRIRLYRR